MIEIELEGIKIELPASYKGFGIGYANVVDKDSDDQTITFFEDKASWMYRLEQWLNQL